MLSIREQRFLTRLQKRFRKKNFEFASDGETQTILVDGEELDFAWAPPLELLEDSCGGTTEVLFNDCVTVIKKTAAAEKQRKRQTKKDYLKQKK